MPAATILQVAAALGLDVSGRRTRCINPAAHRSGEDRHPSLQLFPDTDRYRCPVCGVRGGVLDLVRAVRQVSPAEATAWLSALPGQRTTAGPPASSKPARRPDAHCVEVYEALYGKTHEITKKTAAGRYLRSRGIRDLDLVKKFQATCLQDADEVCDALVDRFGEEAVRAAGLLSHAGHFLFARHELLFFVEDGPDLVYVRGRDITGTAGCKELSLTGLRCPAPFNANILADRPDRVVLCEGAIDTLSALQLGLPAVGVPGVRGFAPDWFDCFRGVRHVVIAFDDDPPGRAAAADLRDRFRLRGLRADAVHPVGGKDVNDLLCSLT